MAAWAICERLPCCTSDAIQVAIQVGSSAMKLRTIIRASPSRMASAILADEIDPRGLGLSIGLYVSGTAFGGMAGRVGTSMLADVWSWHTALASLSVLDLAAALGFALLLPASRHAAVKRQGIPLARHLRIWRGQLTDPALPLLFMVGCLCMGVFVTIYNYAGFRLLAPPFELSPTQTGLIFCAYVFGMAASSAAGGMADRPGQAPVLIAGVLATTVGVLLTLWPHLIGAIGGIVLLTIGFFMTHAVASGWMGRMAGAHKGHAASLYLLAYYLGSSVLGSIGGWFWEHGGWLGVCLFALAGAGIMMGCALKLRQSRMPTSSTSATVPTSNATAPSNA
jgi:YNFM family putative membrane transporter